MPGIFYKIATGEIPSYKIAENEKYFAFLDIKPLVKGHTLVIPKQEIDYIFDVPDDLLSGMLTFAKPIAKAIEKTIPCKRIGIVVLGLEVPHAHIHLIPLNSESDIVFSRPRLQLSPNQFEDIAAQIRKNL